MQTKKITLKSPITVDGVEYKELEMREPTVRDQVLAQSANNPAQNEVQLFANLCGISSDAVMDLTLSNYTRLQEAFSGFLD
ncbi:phage tail assembly protein [Marinomonas rhizomae]|uniref:phage tail assembly protein n=1 Tax=Marinomonas rhizomae TaxID=491948 RepID=UPI002104C695|nr:phage tail assembly protein [Marinomonas rhizomae]UTW01241.1 phage tail assembly protein [Marinomonas rhizomae]